jgi:hypothetical protein
MSEELSRIEADIRRKREALRSNLEELADKMKSVTDWRQHFARHPRAMLAAAAGTGAVLATLIGRGSRTRARAVPAGEPEAAARPLPTGVPREEGLAHQILTPIRDALIGVAVMRATGYLEEKLPGFQEHLKRSRAAQGNGSGSSGAQGRLKPTPSDGHREAGGRTRDDAQERGTAADTERSAP